MFITHSTSCAAWAIFNGFDGTKPTAMTREFAPDRAAVSDSVESETIINKVHANNIILGHKM